MKKLVNRNVAVAAASAALLGVLFLSGAANAITDTVFRYSTPQTGYLSFAGNAFTPPDETTGFFFNNRRELRLTADDFACFTAPVNLPEGADMTELTVWYRNETATLTVTLLKKTHLDVVDGFKELAKKNLPAGAAVVLQANKSITGADAIIDNKRNQYWLEYCAQNAATDAQLNSVRLTYTYIKAGD